VPLVAMTRKPDGTLGRQADFVLPLPNAPEACGIGMAPTTSTTCTMALGDALAVTLMKLRGFERENYLAFHPGGSLGAQLLTVSAVMHKGDELPIVHEATPMSETLLEMTAKGFGVAAVIENGKLTGVITDGDLRRNMDSLMTYKAGDVATRDPLTITPGALLSEALGQMNTHQISALFSVDEDGTLQGLVHIHDILRTGLA
jgi:arabinose-5-phosphate isomerase